MYPSMYFDLSNHDSKGKSFTLTVGPQALLVEICGGPGMGYAFGVQVRVEKVF